MTHNLPTITLEPGQPLPLSPETLALLIQAAASNINLLGQRATDTELADFFWEQPQAVRDFLHGQAVKAVEKRQQVDGEQHAARLLQYEEATRQQVEYLAKLETARATGGLLQPFALAPEEPAVIGHIGEAEVTTADIPIKEDGTVA